MTAADKDTIYIDVDDEITSIIDKVRSAHHKIVALVLPKRAAMLQSTVNMKLLKRAAESSKKNLVLITTESGLLPLAGAVGIHVAKNLQSKPEIPAAVAAGAAADELLEAEEAAEEFDPKSAADKSVGELAVDEEKSPAKPELTPRPIPRAQSDETVPLDNTAEDDGKAAKKAAKKGKDKKLRVPNFEKFRLRVILGIAGAALLIILLIVAMIVLPHATITVATKTSNVNSNLSVALDTSAQALNPNQLVVPANAQQIPKTGSKSVPTTGQKNEGQTATGSVTMSGGSCGLNFPADVPAGTGISTGGLTYITQQDTSFTAANSHGHCVFVGSSATPITAQSAGSQYNVSGASFTVSGRSDVSASGSASGGTTNNVQVVSQTDIDTAKQQISLPSDASMKTTLENNLKAAGYYPIPATFSKGASNVSTSANVGDQATSVTVTETVNYTMFGAHKSDLNTLITNDVNSQINTSKQSIQDTGLNSANFTTLSESGTKAQLTMQTTAVVGPKLNLNTLKQQVAGKKKGDVQSLIEQNPGVTGVKVNYSPFWVSSTPKSTSKITIKFQSAS